MRCPTRSCAKRSWMQPHVFLLMHGILANRGVYRSNAAMARTCFSFFEGKGPDQYFECQDKSSIFAKVSCLLYGHHWYDQAAPLDDLQRTSGILAWWNCLASCCGRMPPPKGPSIRGTVGRIRVAWIAIDRYSWENCVEQCTCGILMYFEDGSLKISEAPFVHLYVETLLNTRAFFR